MATASADGTAGIWDSATGELRLTLRGHADRVISARFSPDGRRLATASLDRTIRLWDAETGHAFGEPLQHQVGVLVAEFATSASVLGALLADRSAAVLWKLEGKPAVQELKHNGLIATGALAR